MKIPISKLTMIVVTAACMGAANASDHHHQFAKDVSAFHAVLAPLWHAKPGPDRLPNACAKVDEMARLAGEIRSTDASNLVASVAIMKTACESKPNEVDGAFYDVHEAFHRLIMPQSTPSKR